MVEENDGGFRLRIGGASPLLVSTMVVRRQSIWPPIVTIMGWSRVGGSVSTENDSVGGKRLPLLRNALWWHRFLRGGHHVLTIRSILAIMVGTTLGAPQRHAVHHWASYRPNRRCRLSSGHRVLIIESMLAAWSSTTKCIITEYNAPQCGGTHPRNFLDAMGSTVCSPSRAF